MGTPTPSPCGERTSRLNDAVRRFAHDCDDVALRRYLHREWPLEDLTRLISKFRIFGVAVLSERMIWGKVQLTAL